MIGTHEMDDLSSRLIAFGDALAFDDAQLVDSVLRRVEAARPRSIHRRWLAVAAIIVAVALAGVALYPDSRHAVARWLGLEGVSIEVDPELSSSPPSSFELPGPGRSQVFEVNGSQILVSTLRGRLGETLISKAVASSDQVAEVEVNGQPGLWISGGAHEVMYESPVGGIVVERVAGNTLLWQHDGVLSRVEGFDDLSQALAFAEGT